MQDGYVHTSISLDELRQLKLQLFQGGQYVDRVSAGMTLRLLGYFQQNGTHHSIIYEIEQLENPRLSTNTKRATQYTGEVLRPYWHKHYFTAYNILGNIGAHWGIHDGGNKRMERMICKIAREHGDIPERWQRELGHQFTIGAIEDRANRKVLTGQVIVFAKYQGQNYYLDVAHHDETDTDVLRKLRDGAAAEFPFLFTESYRQSNGN